nr:MAG TPA: hypothetical protein [Caudoviricetes sp.]
MNGGVYYHRKLIQTDTILPAKAVEIPTACGVWISATQAVLILSNLAN